MSTSEFPIAECIRCGYKWIKRVHRPVTCPQCQSREWDKPFKKKMPKPESGIQAEFSTLRQKIKR